MPNVDSYPLSTFTAMKIGKTIGITAIIASFVFAGMAIERQISFGNLMSGIQNNSNPNYETSYNDMIANVEHILSYRNLFVLGGAILFLIGFTTILYIKANTRNQAYTYNKLA